MIICRNVLIYFNQNLQNKIMQLFHDNLSPGSIMWLDSRKGMQAETVNDNFTILTAGQKIFQKKY